MSEKEAIKHDRHIIVMNMTWFFNRELFMSALGDIKLSKPISLKKMAYTMAFIFTWTLPIFIIWGLSFSLPYLVFMFAPPFVLGHYASKPVWGGKNLIGFTKTIANYIKEPQGWADLKGIKNPDNQDYYVEQEIWVSRRKELMMLAKEKEDEQQKRKRV